MYRRVEVYFDFFFFFFFNPIYVTGINMVVQARYQYPGIGDGRYQYSVIANGHQLDARYQCFLLVTGKMPVTY
jgi:hypothetical protein